MVDVRIHGIGDYELLSNVAVTIRGWDIVIHAGFRWDGATIPRTLWSKVGCPMDFTLESLVHDALYRTHLLDRKNSDKIFHDLIVRNGHLTMLAKTMYLGVRLGGSEAYDEARLMIAHYRNYVSVMPAGFMI